ncbi:MAG: hypothetical protein M1833_007376 [Piccolia ochrophora]|nr:MAG: hypothetical protein M1833_007376 [Piccolia ochrophora]
MAGSVEDAFRFHDLWAPSPDEGTYLDGSILHFTPLLLQEPEHRLHDFFLPKSLDLPSLDLGTADFSTIPSIEDLDESLDSSDAPEFTPNDDELDILPPLSRPTASRLSARFFTWEGFLDPDFVEPRSAYLSEASPHTFDAALRALPVSPDSDEKGGKLVQRDVLLRGLSYLARGRSSALFRYSEDSRSFTCVVDNVCVSGLSCRTVQSTCEHFLECGTNVKLLQIFVDDTYKENTTPATVALASCISILLGVIQSGHLTTPRTLRSLLRLQQDIQRPKHVISCLKHLVDEISQTTDDESISSLIYDKAQQLDHTNDWLRYILLEVLSRSSAPWLDFTNSWIGFSSRSQTTMYEHTTTGGFVEEQPQENEEIGKASAMPDYSFNPGKMPTFISDDDGHVIFETGKSLRLLQVHHPDHPLATADTLPETNMPKLEWHFNWEDVEKIQAKATAYERSLMAAVKHYERNGRSGLIRDHYQEAAPREQIETFGKDESQIDTQIEASADFLDAPLHSGSQPPQDKLQQILFDALSNTQTSQADSLSNFAPPTSMAPLISFTPLIAAQARLVNTSTLHALFHRHQLRHHLNLHHDFHLFASGLFVARLSHALFSPDLPTSSRSNIQSSTANPIGLRLGTRDTWPPASSELRLALMGVLTDSYHASLPPHSTRPPSIPGNLGFAVRSLPAADVPAITDPDSLTALDFLRLHYKPPPPLDAIITPTSLVLYDHIFKHLLRVIRLACVTTHLTRTSTPHRSSLHSPSAIIATRFRIDAHHFTTTLASYIFDVAIAGPWTRFNTVLDNAERRLASGGTTAPPLAHTDNTARLAALHERVLERIAFALLLRKRQVEVRNLLDEILSGILAFARWERLWGRGRADGGEDGDGEEADEVREMYTKWRKRVRVFVSVCRGLSERKGYGEEEGGGGVDGGGLFGGGGEEAGSAIAQLVVRLEMSGYYAEPTRL